MGVAPSLTRPVRLGIVGCGAIVREAHLPAIIGDRRVTVVALCDRTTRNATLLQREFRLDDAMVTDDIRALAGKVDAAIVAVPPRLHAPLAVQLLELGIDVLCEKPLATSAAEGERIAETARRTDRVVAVALMTRFYPHNMRLKEIVEDGELGELREIVAEDGAPLDWAMATNSYFDRKTTAGGVLFDSGIHLLDRVLWLFGDLKDIAYEDDSFGGFETNACLHGHFEIAGQRVPARFEFSWSHRLRRSVRIVGSEGTVEAQIQDPRTLSLTRRTRRGASELLQIRCAESWHATDAYRLQLADFVGAVRERRSPFVSASSAIKALEVIETAYARRTRMAQPWLERAHA